MKGGEKMKKIVAGVLIFCLLVTSCSLWAPPSERVIVVFNTAPDVTVLQQQGAQVCQVFHLIPAIAAVIPAPALLTLEKNPAVKYVARDDDVQVVSESLTPSEPLHQVIPWGVDRIDADRAWLISTGKGVRVAVIDTGIDIDHPDLAANIHGGYNTITHTNDFNDDNGHGTFCSGIIAAVNNRIGVIGVAPDAWLYGVKVLNASGSGTITDIVEGLQWCVDNKMQVINMSWGTSTYNQALHDACDAAWNAGAVLVAPAGDGAQGCYPALFSSVMAISFTDRLDNVYGYFGPEIELAAPGVSIYSTAGGGGYVTMSGSSFGCPHVAGTAALVIAAHPGYTNDQVRRTMWNTAEDLGTPGWDPYYGYGLVDAERAVM